MNCRNLSVPVLPFLLILFLASFMYTPVWAQGECGILVAPGGNDAVDCGLSPGDPCATISNGIDRAQAEGFSCVFVQAGVYPEVLVLVDGVDVIGGYDSSWAAGSHTDPSHRVEVSGGLDAGSGNKYLTVRAHGLTQTTRLSNLVLTGPNAAGQVGLTGKNAYVVHAVNANLLLEDLEIQAGDGANGANGSDGADASSVTATLQMNGSVGGSAAEYASLCDDSSHGNGGAAGINGAIGATYGGTGGNGGEMDTSCDCNIFGCTCLNCDATQGDGGADATIFSVGSYGYGGTSGSPCLAGGNGFDGRVLNGTGGSGASDGAFAGDDWFAQSGSDGGLGQDGGGGGGGGGSGGCDAGTDSYGAGGGGGGAGGLQALGAGIGGGGGGSSFGVFAIDSGVELQDCVITRGAGGQGGQGGVGGRGQDGGVGGAGGAAVGDSGSGGSGGNGGHGGHGGGGGGGAGGVSFGIYSQNSTIIPNNTMYLGGSAGSGGDGGLSAPSAPLALRDGNDGSAGAAGVVGTEFPGASAQQGNHSINKLAQCSIDACLAVAAPEVKSSRFYFSNASPNPGGSEVFFQLELAEATHVRLNIYTVSGRRVLQVVDQSLAAGPHTLRINTRGLSSGTYFARLESGPRRETRKMLVLR